MSADNELAVVSFPDNTHRVVMIQGCPGLESDEPYELTWLYDYYKEFCEAEPFDSVADAIQLAELLEEDGFVEYGITFWKSSLNLPAYHTKPMESVYENLL